MDPAAAKLKLNDGGSIPQLGLGLMMIPVDAIPPLMADAVAAGYRHFDTATHYHNEAGVGEGLRRIEIERKELFVTTKLPNSHHGYDETLRAFDASEQAIGSIDLYLIHWPQPPKRKYPGSWRAMVRLRDEGRVGSIGVSNFPALLIDELIDDSGVIPVVNQVELHPSYQQRDLRDLHAAREIVTESWSPFEHGRALANPVISEIAERNGRSTAQVILNWHLQTGLVVIPKAADQRHLRDNMAALEFQLGPEDMASIDALDRRDGKFGPDPMVHVT